MSGLERLKLGFVPLVDAAPLIVAEQRGFFTRHGLDVVLSREPSWATIRDKVSVGVLDGAHMLAAMPLAATLGLPAFPTPLVSGIVLNRGGNNITVSAELGRQMQEMSPGPRDAINSGQGLARVIARRKLAGAPLLTFGVTFPWSSHNYLLRSWLVASGIDPERDVRIAVVPPPLMVAKLAARHLDGYCVGEPWCQRAADLGIGAVAAATVEIRPGHFEKVLAVRRGWAAERPEIHHALIAAVIEAQDWIDDPANRPEAARLMVTHAFVDAPADLVERALAGRILTTGDGDERQVADFITFGRKASGLPRAINSEWTLAQMQRWGQASLEIDIPAVIAATYLPQAYEAAALLFERPPAVAPAQTQETSEQGAFRHG